MKTGKDMKIWLVKGIIPVFAFVMILIACKDIYYMDGKVDFIRLWMCEGIPFGIARNRHWVLLLKGDFSDFVSVFLFDILIAGIVGGAIAIITVIGAVVISIGYPIGFFRREAICEGRSF